MSHVLVTSLWHSAAPSFLKRGVLGALCAWADDDGTFPHPPTVQRLTDHRYLNARRLCERIVRYQLRLLEHLAVLSAPPHVGGRGHVRLYQLHPAALGRITPAAVRAAAYAKGATETARKGATGSPVQKGAIKGATKGATDASKGGNGGGYVDLKKRKERNPAFSAGTRKGATAPDAAMWAGILEAAKPNVPRWEFCRWLLPTELAADRGDVLQVHTGDASIAGYLQRHYATILCDAAGTVRPGVRIEFV